MPDTLTVSLAKALKLKNRLAGRVAKLSADIQTYNSTQAGAEQVDVPARLAERTDMVRRLVELKDQISTANRPIQRAIFELAEKKAEAALLAGLDTKHGTFKEGYANADVVYVAQVRKAEVDARTSQLEAEIDAIQDRLDGFNHETKLTVDAATVAAAAE